jgi:phage-related protein
MSSQLGEAFVPIRATLDKLDKDLEQARGKVRGTIGRIVKIAEGFGQGVQTAGKAALAGVVGLGGAALAAAGGMAALAANAEPLIGLQQGFAAVTDRIGTSSGTMLSALQDASGGLITNRDLMESFNKAAALVSDDFASTLPDAMSLVRKASQATGQDMGFLFDSLVTGVGRVSPMILDNLGIQISLAEVTEHAAEMFGKQASELSKTEQQAALTEIVMGKLNETYGDVPDTSNTFARARVMLANLKDEIGLKLLPVLTPLVEKLLEAGQMAVPILMGALDSILPVVTSIVTALSNFFAQLMNGIDPITAIVGLIGQLIFAFGGTSAQVQAVNNFVWALVENLRGLWDQITVLLEPFIAWVQQNIQLRDILTALGIAIASVIIPAIIGIVTAIAPVILAFGAVVAAVALLRQAWEENFLGIQEFVGTALETIQTVISTALTTIQTWWATHGEQVMLTVSTFMTNAWTTIMIVFNTVKAFISTALATIQAWWSAHGSEVVARVSAFMSGAWSTIQGVIETVKGFISGALSAISAWWAEHGASIIATVTNYLTIVKTFVETVLQGISDFWNTHGQQIMEFAKSAWETVQEIVNYALVFIQELINAVAAVIEGDWDAFGAALQRIWNTLWETVKSMLSTAWEGIKTLVSIGLDALVSLVTNIGPRLYSAGQSIVERLREGLKNKLEEIKGWFSDRLAEITDLLPFSEPRDPSSPFRGLGESGEAIVQNLLKGMQRVFPKLEDFVAGKLAPQFDLDRMMPGMNLAERDMVPAGNSISYTSETTIHTDRDPLRVLRASRHLDKLGALT